MTLKVKYLVQLILASKLLLAIKTANTYANIPLSFCHIVSPKQSTLAVSILAIDESTPSSFLCAH